MSQLLTRRNVLALIPLSAFGVAWRAVEAQAKDPITIYKDPNCGCCSKWVEHMEASGFKATVISGDMGPVKARFKVPANLGSCHTSIIQGYVIEGHVPAADIRKFLAAKPKGLIGLTIPGMPQSAPGMDQKPFQPYDVLTFDAAGKTTVYARHDKG